MRYLMSLGRLGASDRLPRLCRRRLLNRKRRQDARRTARHARKQARRARRKTKGPALRN